MTFNTDSSIRLDVKNEALKRQLLERVDEEKKNFLVTAEMFYGSQRRAERDYQHLCEAVIKAVDQVLIAHQWEASLFLHNTLKPLYQLREQAIALQKSLNNTKVIAREVPSLAKNTVKLYISLYQINGHDLKQWAAQLASLPSYMIGRPIYQQEAEVIAMSRAKLAQASEAYVVVAVNKEKIIQDAGLRKDRCGHALISLLPNAILSSQILEFVHQDKRYHYDKGQLIPIVQQQGVNP